jgi:hypothetical protein
MVAAGAAGAVVAAGAAGAAGAWVGAGAAQAASMTTIKQANNIVLNVFISLSLGTSTNLGFG